MAGGGSIGNDPVLMIIVLALIGIFTLGAMLWHGWQDKTDEEWRKETAAVGDEIVEKFRRESKEYVEKTEGGR